MKESEIVGLISRKIVPFILLFGCYLIAYGHVSPGGGFQGGVVLASGFLLIILSRGIEDARKLFPVKAIGFLEIAGLFSFLMFGITGILITGQFLSNFLPLGETGALPSASFIFFLNVIIGIKVGAGMTVICSYLLKDE